jgi:hypothetical protein
MNDTTTRRILVLATYRCRAQLLELSTNILARAWDEAQLAAVAELEQLRRVERQALRRAYQAKIQDPDRLRGLFILGLKRTLLRMGLEAAGAAALLYVVYLWSIRT